MKKPHISVLLQETIEGLNIKPDGIYIDLTLGRGGHSLEILSRLSINGFLIGVDQDSEAIKYSEELFSKDYSNFRLIKDNFRNLDNILDSLKISKVDGILMDLGVSSPQFDDKDRGFSYRYDSTLDMRMDKENTLTAKEIVNTYSLESLFHIFKEYGEESKSYQIAKAIVKEREIKEINTTFEFIEIIKRCKTQKELAKKGHPAKQIFQALRIEVNDELGALNEALNSAYKHLNSDGRLAIITFQSLEDKMVKKLFKDLTYKEGNRLNFASNEENIGYELINKKVIIAGQEELEENLRAKSAKLRILRKVGENYER